MPWSVLQGQGHGHDGEDDGQPSTNQQLLVRQLLWILLLLCYATIFILSFMRIFRIWLFRHRFGSFQGAYLCMTVFWCVLRIVFWAANTTAWPSAMTIFLYWVPDMVQYAMLSLIALYNYKIVHVRYWDELRSRAYVLYCVLNMAYSGALTAWLIVQRWARNSGHPIENSGLFFALASGAAYGSVVLFLVYYAWRVYRIRQRQRRSLRNPFSTSSAMVCLTVAVFLVFTVKPIKSFESDVVDLPNVVQRSVSLSNFFLLSACEIVPTFLLILMFRAAPSSRVTRCSVCFRPSASLEELEESLYHQSEGQSSLPRQWSSSQQHRRSWGQIPVANNTYSSSSSSRSGNGLLTREGGHNSGENLPHTLSGYSQSSSTSHPRVHHIVSETQQTSAESSFGGSGGDTRLLYDSDSDSSPMFKQVKGSTPGTPLYLPPAGSSSLVPAMAGGRIFGSVAPPSPNRHEGSTVAASGSSFSSLGPRDLLNSVSDTSRF